MAKLTDSPTAEGGAFATIARGEPHAAVEEGWLDPQEMRAWRTFIDGSDRLMEVLNRSLQAKHGLTMDDYRILVLLSEAPGRALRMSDLALGIVASRSKLTHQIRRLESAGLVEREECSSDKRGVLALLTPTGLTRLEQAAPDHVADVRKFMIDAMTVRQLRMLGDAFEKVRDRSQVSVEEEANEAKKRVRDRAKAKAALLAAEAAASAEA